MRRSTKWLLLGGSIGTAAALVSAYGTAIRSWHLRWGATNDELRKAMPFDDAIGDPNFFTTRAITVDANVDDVWPLLSDSSLFPCGTILRCAREKQWLALAPPEVEAEATWVVTLEKLDETRTRIVTRTRARFAKRIGSVLRYLIVDPAQFVIERNWLLAIKTRAEAASPNCPSASPCG